MLTAAITSAALMATAAHALGAAKVVNKCSYPVHMYNTPASGGGFNAIDKVLAPNDDYSQTWTQLSNDQGWSIKLSKSDALTNIMQYEYTYHTSTPDIIWYDLSDVNGNPWNANWEITASTGCSPKQQAYRYSTDDAYGMQACPSDSEITVTLCSGDSSDNGGAASASQSVAAESSWASSSQAAQSTAPASSSAPATSASATSAPATSAPASSSAAAATSAPASSSFTTPSQSAPTWWNQGANKLVNGNVQAPASSSAPSPTTLATSTSAAAPNSGEYGATVTDIQTKVVTNVVTATAEAPAKRHEHHPRHPHNRHV